MKTNISVSKEGINFDRIQGRRILQQDKFVENYAHSALAKIVEMSINLKIKVPIEYVETLFNNYNEKITEYCITEYADGKETLDNLQKAINSKSDIIKIDDIIALLRGTKPHLQNIHKCQYTVLKQIVLENCQMEDNSVL